MIGPMQPPPSRTPRQIAEGWARREMLAAGNTAERDLMAIVTGRVASLFATAREPGRVTAEDWQKIVAWQAARETPARRHKGPS